MYQEPLRWKEGVQCLVVTARRQPPAEGVQLLDAGLPFSAEDLAAFLARRPATVKNITIHPSAQSYDRATLKPLMQVIEHPRVKAEIERFHKDGGSVTMAGRAQITLRAFISSAVRIAPPAARTCCGGVPRT